MFCIHVYHMELSTPVVPHHNTNLSKATKIKMFLTEKKFLKTLTKLLISRSRSGAERAVAYSKEGHKREVTFLTGYLTTTVSNVYATNYHVLTFL